MRWAVLRGRADLGDPGGDVDLLVHEDDLDSFEDVVLELGAYVLPRVRVPTSWSRAVLRHSWHRFYLVPDPTSGESVKLDVVTSLVYSKALNLESGLAHGCLERRVRDDGVWVLDPTDTFWTMLLHSLLDKQKVAPHRAAELESTVATLRRPSPGEEFFETICPPGFSADQAVALVQDRDWPALAGWARPMLGRPPEPDAGETAVAAASEPRRGRRARVRRGGRSALRVQQALRTAAVATYPVVWRRAGLGAVPRVLDLLEDRSVDATVLHLRRRPAACDVLVLVPAEQRAAVDALLRTERYRPVSGSWYRPTAVGVEKVRVVTARELPLADEALQRLRDTSLPMAGRTHCRRAVGPGGRLDRT